MKKFTLQLNPVINFQPYILQGHLTAFNAGHNGRLYAFVANKQHGYSNTVTSGVVSIISANKENMYNKLHAPISWRFDFYNSVIADGFNIHNVQPLSDNELLLACARSHFKGPDDIEKNGRIYGSDMELKNEILLGDGIMDVQVTKSGTIWTSYTDEGVFGNFGWNQPIGESGLVAWDRYGKKIFEYSPTSGLDDIIDCYALNVKSDNDVYFFYYTDFFLVHLRAFKVHAFWETPEPVHGSHAFAVSKGMVLFAGGYDERNKFFLTKMTSNSMIEILAELQLADMLEEQIQPQLISARGNVFWLYSGKNIYHFTVEAVLEKYQKS
ncbi:MAG: hypothetical protein HZB23_08170 [Deltaproteobacteria bacterium]|nr:hypothetical protein [Deltaproteobacteria bacterium]